VIGALPFLLAGCGTLPDGHAWGDGATLSPGWERVRVSAVNAASDPWVWAPLLGAGVLQVDNWDHRVSDWARTETPVFGSTANAEHWSDDLRTTAVVAHAASVLFTPSGDSGSEWILNKAKGYGVQLAAAAVAGGATAVLKKTTNRERPNCADTESFPSGHAVVSAVYDRLASENLDWIDMTHGARVGLKVGLDAVTIGTSWARIEAGAHFPSDTLVSMAIGNFCGAFFNDAFLGLSGPRALLAFVPLPRGGEVRWQVSFGER
jgi:membrane-associated phospholipid phosphatase